MEFHHVFSQIVKVFCWKHLIDSVLGDINRGRSLGAELEPQKFTVITTMYLQQVSRLHPFLAQPSLLHAFRLQPSLL